MILTQIRNGDCNPLPDVLIAVPMAYWSSVKRGFNQNACLARHLAKQLAVPVEVKLIARNSGPSQRSLSRIQRFRRIQDLFRWQGSRRLKPLNGLHVAIVDDVITTGSTIREIGKILSRQGAVRIDAWCATRTPRKTN